MLHVFTINLSDEIKNKTVEDNSATVPMEVLFSINFKIKSVMDIKCRRRVRNVAYIIFSGKMNTWWHKVPAISSDREGSQTQITQ
jgi:hypothetical protein